MTVYQEATASGRQFWQGQIPASTVAAPTTACSLSATGTGATLTAGTYFVKYTWVTATGETTPSAEPVSTVIAGQTLTVTIPALPAGVTKANIYISMGAAGAETLQGSTTTTTFTQSAPITTTGPTPPTTNNAGATTLYTAPSYSAFVTSDTPGISANAGSTGSSTAYVKSIVATNTTGSPATLNLYMVPPGGAAGAANAYQFFSTAIPANNAITLSELNDMMPAGATLQALSGMANAITLTISGVEVQ